MGVPRNAQRLATPAALARVRALATSTSPTAGSQAADAGQPGSAASKPVTLDATVSQAPASVTDLETPLPGSPDDSSAPAVHVAATAGLGHEVAGPRIAQVLLD